MIQLHILLEGLPLCRFTDKVPKDWPEDHKWAHDADFRNLLRGGKFAETVPNHQRFEPCDGCKTALDVRSLHIYEFGDTDWVVATSPEDAWIVWLAHVGGTRADYLDTEEPDLVPDDKRVGFWVGADGKITEVNDGAVVYKTAREWADREGRGYLASTEY
jgi:hypothetical protein